MTSKSTLRYAQRAHGYQNPVAKKLFQIGGSKSSNIVVSADLTRTKELLELADNFGEETVAGLKPLSSKHNFMIFEDRKFVDISNTVQKQYNGGVLQISEWAHLVNALQSSSVTAVSGPSLILADMTTKGSLATGDYTKACIESVRKHKDFFVGFVATQALTSLADEADTDAEDFIVFTTGVNRSTNGDKLDQQFQTPEFSVKRVADFIIAGRGIYATDDPAKTAKLYQE